MKSRMKTWILKVNTFSRDINKLQIDIVLVQVIMMMQLYGDVTLPMTMENSMKNRKMRWFEGWRLQIVGRKWMWKRERLMSKKRNEFCYFQQKGVAAINFAGNNFLQSIMERCVTTWHKLNMMH